MTTRDQDGEDAFVSAFWRDVDAGQVAPLPDYVARYPDLEEQVRAEYAAWQGDAGRDGPAGSAPRGAAGADSIGRYQVTGTLTRGGMGLLLLGYDPELCRRVVLKTPRSRLAPLDHQHCERLRREVRLASRLVHDAICPILDVVVQDERVFAVMPLIEGESFAEWIERAAAARGSAPLAPLPSAHPLTAWCEDGALPPLLLYLEKVARAIHFAHEAGIVHRDLKPANLMVRGDGEPVVLDFGLALELDASGDRLTSAGELVGSPLYMAPEQIDGPSESVDRRTDVYGLGVVLYESITLVPPFSAPSQVALLDQVRRGNPLRPRALNPGIPRDLEAVCLKAMAFDRRDRYDSAQDLADDIHAVLTVRATRARRLTVTEHMLRRVWRSRRTTAAALVIVVLLALVGVFAWRGQRLAQHTDAARALVRVLEAMAANVDPPPADLAALATHFPDPDSLEVAMAAGREKDLRAFVGATMRALQDEFRSASKPQSGVRLVAPRAAVTTTRPTFVFALPAGGDARRELVLRGAAGEHWTWPLPADGAERGNWELPAEIALTPGCEYGWNVRPASPAGMAADDTEAAYFRVVPPAAVATLRAAVRSTGDRRLDSLVLASALLGRDLAAAAIAELEGTSMPVPLLERLRRVLLVKAAQRLHDTATIQAQARDAPER